MRYFIYFTLFIYDTLSFTCVANMYPLCYATCGPYGQNMEPTGDMCRIKEFCKDVFENDVFKGIEYIFAIITTTFPNENWLVGFISFVLPGKSLLSVFHTHTTIMYSVSSGLQLNGYWYYIICVHTYIQ